MALHNTQFELQQAEEREKEQGVSETEMADRYCAAFTHDILSASAKFLTSHLGCVLQYTQVSHLICCTPYKFHSMGEPLKGKITPRAVFCITQVW